MSLNYRTSIAHHDSFSACTWSGGTIQAVSLPKVPATTTVAEGSFHIMKVWLPLDGHFVSHDPQIGYLLAMINGDVNKRIPSWALWPQTIFVAIICHLSQLCCTFCM